PVDVVTGALAAFFLDHALAVAVEQRLWLAAIQQEAHDLAAANLQVHSVHGCAAGTIAGGVGHGPDDLQVVIRRPVLAPQVAGGLQLRFGKRLAGIVDPVDRDRCHAEERECQEDPDPVAAHTASGVAPRGAYATPL